MADLTSNNTQQQPSSLGDVFQKAKNNPVQTDDAGYYPDEALGTSVSSQDALENLDKVANKYQASAPPESLSEFKQAIAAAKEARNKQVNANEWGEVAQNLGDAIVKFGITQHAMGNQGERGNVPSVDSGRGIDFGARSKLAQQAYEQDVHNALTGANLAREQYQDTEKAKQENQRNSLIPAQDLVRQSESEESARRRHNEEMDRQESLNSRADTRATSAENAAETRAQAAEDRANKRQSNFESRQQATTDRQQEKSLSDQLAAGQSLISDLVNEEDMPSKERIRAQATYSTRAARAGDLNIPELRDAIRKAKNSKEYLKNGTGIAGTNIGRDVDTAAIQKSLIESNPELARRQKDLNDVRARLKPQNTGMGTEAAGVTPPLRDLNNKQQTAPPAGLRVKDLQTGKTGILTNPADFDPTKYKKI